MAAAHTSWAPLRKRRGETVLTFNSAEDDGRFLNFKAFRRYLDGKSQEIDDESDELPMQKVQSLRIPKEPPKAGSGIQVPLREKELDRIYKLFRGRRSGFEEICSEDFALAQQFISDGWEEKDLDGNCCVPAPYPNFKVNIFPRGVPVSTHLAERAFLPMYRASNDSPPASFPSVTPWVYEGFRPTFRQLSDWSRFARASPRFDHLEEDASPGGAAASPLLLGSSPSPATEPIAPVRPRQDKRRVTGMKSLVPIQKETKKFDQRFVEAICATDFTSVCKSAATSTCDDLTLNSSGFKAWLVGILGSLSADPEDSNAELGKKQARCLHRLKTVLTEAWDRGVLRQQLETANDTLTLGDALGEAFALLPHEEVVVHRQRYDRMLAPFHILVRHEDVCHEMYVTRLQHVKTLRKAIAEAFGTSISRIQMTHGDVLLQNDAKTLQSIGIVDDGAIITVTFAELGSPLLEISLDRFLDRVVKSGMLSSETAARERRDVAKGIVEDFKIRKRYRERLEQIEAQVVAVQVDAERLMEERVSLRLESQVHEKRLIDLNKRFDIPEKRCKEYIALSDEELLQVAVEVGTISPAERLALEASIGPAIFELQPSTRKALVERTACKAAVEQWRHEVKKLEVTLNRAESRQHELEEEKRRGAKEVVAILLEHQRAVEKTLERLEHSVRVSEFRLFFQHMDLPPNLVRVADAASILLCGRPLVAAGTMAVIADEWKSLQSVMLKDLQFVKVLRGCRVDGLSHQTMTRMRPIIEDPCFQPSAFGTCAKFSEVAAGLCCWVRAVYALNEAQWKMSPRKRELATLDSRIELWQVEIGRRKKQVMTASEAIGRLMDEMANFPPSNWTGRGGETLITMVHAPPLVAPQRSRPRHLSFNPPKAALLKGT